MIIRRIDEDNYSVDGMNMGGIYNLHDYMNMHANRNIGFRQVMFMVSHRSVAKTMLAALPGLEYFDDYYGIATQYPRKLESIKPYYPVVSANTAHVHIKYYKTSTGKPDRIEYILNDEAVVGSLNDLIPLLSDLRIFLTEGQIRFILAHGINEEQSSKYPNLRFTSEKIQYVNDRRLAEVVDGDHSSDKIVKIVRFGTDQYRYNNYVMTSGGVRQKLAEDGFIINKNVISLIFGQGKIPKSVADRYPNLKYEDLR